ncbi:MAG: ATP-dependent DNA helicase [Gammaproteobacteria bacterium]|nr:ATP-dependent DNA helicase [Gammaproteobacteria bacterium]
MSASIDALRKDGPIAETLAGFAPRLAQQQMAECIEHALLDAQTLVVESGTGTGKTFAYLVPIVLSGKTAIVSTATRHLQDQLFYREIPLVRDALQQPVTVALLKGRANYLCQHRLKNIADNERDLFAVNADLEQVKAWSLQTANGDIAELDNVEEGAGIWPLVTSTTDNCLGTKCEHFDRCYVNRARRAALGADIVIVNHHLFFADLVLKEDGFGDLLPRATAVVFDEAHQLPAIASLFLGTNLTGGQLRDLCRDIHNEEKHEHSAIGALPDTLRDLEQTVRNAEKSLRTQAQRGALVDLEDNDRCQSALLDLQTALQACESIMEQAAVAGPGLERCWHRSVELQDNLQQLLEREQSDYVRWYEVTGASFRLCATPLEPGTVFRQRIGSDERAWIFTSATLAVGDDFSHYLNTMGLSGAQTRTWESPFPYATQSLLYLPENMPDPREPEFTPRVGDLAYSVLRASGGRAFLLFTSFRALEQARSLLAGRLPFPVLVQGDAPRNVLLEQFRARGNAVLLGTASFWEGVDVRGEALSCVIIDRLPFAPPDDPVLRARLARIEETGGNPFRDYQVPSAVIVLKQGVGRLIRDSTDRGVLVICDPRLTTKGYGKIFRRALPPMPVTRNFDDVARFFDNEDSGD